MYWELTLRTRDRLGSEGIHRRKKNRAKHGLLISPPVNGVGGGKRDKPRSSAIAVHMGLEG